MEELSHLGDNPRGGGFRYASSSVATASNTTTTTTPITGVVAPPTSASVPIYCGPNLNASTLPRFHPPKPEASSSSSHRYPFARPTDVDAMKARIISHPHYSNLLKAYMDCQKVFLQISPLLLSTTLEVNEQYIYIYTHTHTYLLTGGSSAGGGRPALGGGERLRSEAAGRDTLPGPAGRSGARPIHGSNG